LQQADLSGALETYDEAIANAPNPVPADMLMQISGDLGNHDHLVELLKLAGPLFNPDAHGLLVGNNLIKANLDLGRVDHAKTLVDKLYGLKRHDFQQSLAFWETEIAKARVAADNAGVRPPVSVTMLALQGPIWLAPNSPAASLFPNKQDDALSICILGSTAETGAEGEPQLQMADIPGRISRGVTLFLCEQIHLRTNALCQVLQPWIAPGGFTLSGKPWVLETAIDQAKACQPSSDYVILIHLVATSRPYRLSFRLIRCIDGSPLDSHSIDLDPENLEPAYRQLAKRILQSIDRHAHVDSIAQPAAYHVPEGGCFNDYQLRLEQALAVRVAAMGDTRPDFLSGEHEVITGMLHLCLATPSSVSARIMLFDTLRRLKEVSPQVPAEFRERIEMLQKGIPRQRWPAPHSILCWLRYFRGELQS
jgi:hypothetical protein